MFLVGLRKVRCFWFTIFTSVITLAFLIHVQLLWKPVSFEHHKFWWYDLNAEEPEELQQACQLPKIHPFDPSILSYLTSPKIIRCKERQPSLTFLDENGILRFNETALKIKKYNSSDLQCYYQEIHRKTDFILNYGEKLKLFSNGSKIHSDFLYVSCTDFVGFSYYSNIHCHVVPKQDRVIVSVNTSKPIYNVFIFGLDSLSRQSFIRNLPDTYEFLTQKLKAYVFRGMTKIGDNTFPNIGAMLTGKCVFSNELPNVKDPKESYDKWPYIWKNFSKANYVTLFAEDLPKIGLFTYYRGGLEKQPTDHYLRPFWLAVETSKVHLASSNLCFGNTPKHILQLNYTRDFVAKYATRNIPFFAFSFYVELTHDFSRVVQNADKDLKSWLSSLHDSGYLNNTFLFFLSDHGHRFDSMRSTLVGRIEERMPFFSVVVPPLLLKTHPEVIKNLKNNIKRLTTPYDVYFSALDILGHSISGINLGTTTSERGTSIFGPISLNRTCKTAGIPDHYCVCEKEEGLDVSDKRAKASAETVLRAVNKLTQFTHGNFCAVLSLKKIVRCDIIMPPNNVVINSRIYFGKLKTDSRPLGMLSKLRVIIETIPGNALFEATVQFREDEDSYSVVGDISRINKYGSQSECIKEAILRKYCFCIHGTTNT